MTADELRKSILQMAVQGKLVDQDPNDEPASVLLDKIKEERKKLIQSGKIKGKFVDSVIYKGDDNSYYEKVGNKVTDITDEIPFDLPVGWSWCRVDSLCLTIFSGKSPQYSKTPTNHIVIGQQANQWTGVDLKYIKYCTPEFVEDMPSYYYLHDGDILLNTLGNGTLGRSGIFEYSQKISPILTDGHLFVFRTVNKIISHYLLAVLRVKYNDIVKTANGTTNQTFLNLSSSQKWLVPVPPLKEQERIIKKVNELEPLLADYDKLETTERTLTENLPNELRKSILQYAIQGKLVPQDPNDEPASVLLERIRKEKELQLGKKSKKNTDSFIYKNSDDNSYYPFDIPSNWCWCQLQDIVELISGRDLEKQDYNNKNNGIPYITGASNINNDEIIINRWTDKPQVVSIMDDLLLTCKGTVGTMAFNKIGDIHIARQIMALRSSRINMEYLRVFLESYVGTLQANAKSMIPGISRDNVLLAYLPLPPIEEQERIVNAIKNSLILLNSLIMRNKTN